MSNRKLGASLFAALGAALILGYAAFWYGLASRIEKQIVSYYAEAVAEDIRIEGAFPQITGFPRPHKITFSGALSKNGWHLILPRLEVTGFMLPGQTLDISLPEGISLTGAAVADQELFSLNYAYLKGDIPRNLPYDLTVEALRAWRAQDGMIEISEFEIHKDALRIKGNGRFHLDNDLQPEGEITVRVTGHIAFLGYLQQKNLIEGKKALITGTVIGGLSRQDPETGERYLDALVTLQNRKLLLGPLQLFDLPYLEWDYDNPPARLL